MKQFFLSAALLSMIAISPLRADDPPGSKLLEETANRAKVANQALKATVNDALSKAGKLPADSALVILQDAETQVKEASYLSAEEKKSLLDQISSKMKTLSHVKPADEPRPTSPKQDQAVIQHEIHQELNAIRSLQQQGNQSEAQARLKALTEKYPNNQALLASSALSHRQETARDADRINKQKAGNQQAALTDIDKSAGNVTPDNIKYDPKVWDKAKDRQPVTLSSLTNREKQILNKLDEKSSTDFVANQTPFEQVLKMLEKEIGCPLIISKATMDDMRITYDSQLTYNMPKGVAKRTLLKSVLGELGLTFVIKTEVLQVMSILQAKNEMRSGILDIRTMIRAGSNPEDIIRMIKTTVEPDSWDISGGPGTITYSAGILNIRNSAEVIYNLGARRK